VANAEQLYVFDMKEEPPIPLGSHRKTVIKTDIVETAF